MVLETLGFSPLKQLTRLVAREYFIIQCRRESYNSYIERKLSQQKRDYLLEFVSRVAFTPEFLKWLKR
jgi:hypothetical protein